VGSLAFGALLIVPVRLARWFLLYLQAKTKEVENPVSKCFFGMAQCCLKCCQCLLDTICKEGFVFTTIYGTNFCYSGLTALKLLWVNIGRAAMVQGISKYMEIFGRIGISALTTGLCLFVLYVNPYYKSHISSFIFPCVVIFILSYMIAALFMMVFEVAVDTIFLCFLVDEEVNGQPKFAHAELHSMVAIRKDVDNDKQYQVQATTSTKDSTSGASMQEVAV